MTNRTYFTTEFFEFFHDLAGNNNTSWFHANKPRYEQHVKQPFETFITDLIAEIQPFDPSLQVTAKDCVLRINRDLRFSKDKQPYNLHVTAFVSQGGRKDKSIPGIFLRFAPESIGIMGGCYYASPANIQKIRERIRADISGFRALIDENAFVETFTAMQGDAIKRIPAQLKSIAEREPLILNTQWYFTAEREPEIMVRPELMREIMTYYQAAKPVNDFLFQALMS
jgi:uncharacterized protein (TIGR02453 family)